MPELFFINCSGKEVEENQGDEVGEKIEEIFLYCEKKSVSFVWMGNIGLQKSDDTIFIRIIKKGEQRIK